jgi:hypothetical protein
MRSAADCLREAIGTHTMRSLRGTRKQQAMHKVINQRKPCGTSRTPSPTIDVVKLCESSGRFVNRPYNPQLNSWRTVGADSISARNFAQIGVLKYCGMVFVIKKHRLVHFIEQGDAF